LRLGHYYSQLGVQSSNSLTLLRPTPHLQPLNVGQTRVEHHAKIIDRVMNDLSGAYHTIDKEFFNRFDRYGKLILDEDGKPAINYSDYLDAKTRLSSQIGFMAQTATGQSKAIMYDTEIKQIKRILNRVPPEVMEKYTSPAALEVLVDGDRSASQ